MRKLLSWLLLGLSVSTAFADGSNVAPGLRSNVIEATRDLTAISGSVAYTGMGFKPTTCEAFGAVGPIDYVAFNGWSNPALTTQRTLSSFGVAAQFTLTSNLAVFYDSVGTSAQTFSITSYDADGFTGTWTKIGTPTGTANLRFRCMR